MEAKTLKQQYENVIDKYIKAFEEKHNTSLEYWVADDKTGIACFGDCAFFNLSDIIYDIDNIIKPDLIFQWIYDCVDNEGKTLNFQSYSKGLRFEDIKEL